MDPRERYNDHEDAFRIALDARQAQIHTCFPGIVQSFDAAKMTAVVQPAIKYQVRDQAGTWNWVTLPLLLDCPVHFPGGGGFSLTFPLGEGDECLALIAERCIDGWWESGGVQPQAEFRMHDLSDGFCIPKVWSQPKKLSGVSTSTAQLRSDDGSTYVEVSAGHVVNVKAPTKVILDTPIVQVTGAIEVLNENEVAEPCQISGDINATGNVVAGAGGADQVSLQSHVHGGVQPGSGSTAAPTAGT